jgi:hypothetical protein
MFCRNCGAINDDNAFKCVSCGQAVQGAAAGAAAGQGPVQYVPNHLVQAILVTVCCCLPFGIVAIVYAASVNGKLQAGDYAGAADASRKAAIWSWVGLGVGLLWSIGWFALSIIMGAAKQFAR